MRKSHVIKCQTKELKSVNPVVTEKVVGLKRSSHRAVLASLGLNI